jgi:signal transduction histidine kinase
MATAALLAAEAYRARQDHRRTAESVLRDYAALAAAEMVRRSAMELGYYGYYPLATAIGAAARAPGGLDEKALAKALVGADKVNDAPQLVENAFTWAPDRGARGVARPLADDVSQWLSTRLARGPKTSRGFSVLHAVLGGRPHSFVVVPVDGQPSFVGFEVALEVLPGWFRRALGRGAVLPPSLGGGTVTNGSLSVVVRDHAGVERFRSTPTEWPQMKVDVPFGDAYEGALEGSTVAVSLEPGAAQRLIIGGVPRSRMPALLALGGLTAGLLLTALFQLRRERELQHARSEFVASVSHELRTPLTQIRMFAETLLLDRVRSDEERRRALEIVDKEARRLGHLVENLLHFSRIERGAVEVTREDRELGPLIRDVIAAFRPVLDGAEVDFSLEVADDLHAIIDPDALRQVLLNVLDNAVKYGPRRQRVRLTLARASGRARIMVEDEGPGIPAAERDKVFDRFHRLDRERGRAIAGTGIGLSVVRDLVHRQGGRCFVEDGPGGGARVVIDLPSPDGGAA